MVKTKSFELATYAAGDPDASRVALVLPGRLDTKDYVHMRSHVDFLAQKGFYALSFDPPGTWESSGTLSLYTTTNYIKAVNEMVEYFGNKPTLLVGHSRGAAVSILASSHPAVVGIVLAMANFGEPSAPGAEATNKGYKLSYRDLPPGTFKTKKQREFKLPIAYWEDGKRYDPGETLKTCSKPKLLIYGTRDEFTPTELVEKLFAEIPEPKMLLKLDWDHDYRYNLEMIAEVEKATEKFLNSYEI